jgi:hypothetical protein
MPGGVTPGLLLTLEQRLSEVYFTADPDGLDALSQRLSSLEDGMHGVTVAVDSYPPPDLSPAGDVWNALKAFSQSWTDGLTVISGNVNALQQRLAAASALYRSTDQKIGDAARQGTGSWPPDRTAL